MSSPPDDVAAPQTRRRRSIATWVILFTVWTVGLIFWTLYLGLAMYVLYRIM